MELPIHSGRKAADVAADPANLDTATQTLFLPDSFALVSVNDIAAADETGQVTIFDVSIPSFAGDSLGFFPADTGNDTGNKAPADSHTEQADADASGDEAAAVEVHASPLPASDGSSQLSAMWTAAAPAEAPHEFATNAAFEFVHAAAFEPTHAFIGDASKPATDSASEPANPVSVAPAEGGDAPPTVLVDGDGQIVSVLSNSTAGGGGSSGGGSGTGSATHAATAGASPFVINISYDSSVNSAPAAFKTAIAAAVQYFESQFTDHVTINIAVGYGEVGGYTLGSGALGESLTYLSNYSYSQVKNSLSADAKTADDAAAVGSLSASSPVSGTFWESTAEAKATGLLGASSSLDGYVGFAKGNLFDYDNSNGVSAGQYDFFGVVSHEITEVMGRALLVGETIGQTPHGYYPLDLFHYAANGVRDFSGATPGYFSIDGGATKLDSFNTNPGGDYGDWASSAGNDSFLAFSPSGTVESVSQTDLRELDVIGWDRGSSGSAPPPAPPPAQADLTVTGFAFTGAHFSYHVNDIGAGAAGPSTAGIYVSYSPSGPLSLIGAIGTGALAAGASDTELATITWASNPTPGTYFISVGADYKNAVAESNESNNQSPRIAIVLGNGGNNTLTGTSGDDVFIGLGGKDTLTGGAGADQFVFNTALSTHTAVATITDFTLSQSDKIDLDHGIFTALTHVAIGGSLSSTDFYASSNGASHSATDRVLYNTTTGALSYDADGTGAAAAVQFAALTHHPALTSHDILVV